MKLGKKMVVVPTPGQGEQEYLAQYLSSKNYLATINQNKFSLKKAVTLAFNIKYQFNDPRIDNSNSKMNDYKIIINKFIKRVMSVKYRIYT